MTESIVTIAAVGLGVFLALKVINGGGTFTTAGEKITLSNKGGFIVDETGRVWL